MRLAALQISLFFSFLWFIFAFLDPDTDQKIKQKKSFPTSSMLKYSTGTCGADNNNDNDAWTN